MFSKIYGRIYQRLLAFDPGYINLRSAVRGTLAVVICFFILSAVARHTGTPASLAFLGVLITMMASIVVTDAKKSDQKITTVLIPIPTTVAATLSVMLADWPYARLACFLIVTFAAVSVRRFGIRYIGLGVITFMSYFATLFFPFHPSDIGLVIAALFIATAIAYAARFWILPDRTSRLLGLYLKAFDIRLNRTLDTLIAAMRYSAPMDRLERGKEPPQLWKELRQRFVSLNELSVGIEQFATANESHTIRTKSDLFQLKLFEHEVALRRLWDHSFELLHLEERDRNILLTAAQAVETLRKDGSDRSKDFESYLTTLGRYTHDETVANFVTAIKNVKKTLDTQDFNPGEISTLSQNIDDLNLKSGSAPAPKETLHISTRQAIQATLATALASLLGTTVSPQRWYWASISAFMVFIGATRGETMMRAVLRIVGTVLGLILGFTLAYAFTGQTGLEWSLIIFCVFFGIYGARLTFGFWTAGLFSSMFALLYDILGLLNKDIIFLRVEETLIGAFIGVIVAAMVLPTSTHTVFRKALADFLYTLSAILASLPLEAPSPFARRTLIRKLRKMDRELMDVRLAAAPIVGRGSLMKQGEMPGALHDATMLAHYIRHLAINVDPRSELSEEAFQAACDDLASSLRKEADSIAAHAHVVKEKLPWSTNPSKNMNGPRHSLERIRISIASIGSRKI